MAHVLGLEGAIMDPISVIVMGSTYGTAFNLAEYNQVLVILFVLDICQKYLFVATSMFHSRQKEVILAAGMS